LSLVFDDQVHVSIRRLLDFPARKLFQAGKFDGC
jgi:hypothetical protein